MMDERISPSQHILLAVEDAKLQDYLGLLLIGEGLRVTTYTSHEELLDHPARLSFDLIITQFSSPHIKALEVIATVRRTFLLRQAPIIVIVPQNDPIVKAKMLYAGADDFIDEGALKDELLLKVKTSLLRTSRYQDQHPLTGLAGLSSALKVTDQKIREGKPFAAAYADAHALKHFNARYDFSRGDKVITYTAFLIRDLLKSMGSSSDFLAHLGGGNFYFLTFPERMEPVCTELIRQFTEKIPSFYDENDKAKGCVHTKNRQGVLQRYPFLILSIGSTSSAQYPLFSAVQILEVITELKNHARTFDNSFHMKERRRRYPFK